jgi:hypothetical protein
MSDSLDRSAGLRNARRTLLVEMTERHNTGEKLRGRPFANGHDPRRNAGGHPKGLARLAREAVGGDRALIDFYLAVFKPIRRPSARARSRCETGSRRPSGSRNGGSVKRRLSQTFLKMTGRRLISWFPHDLGAVGPARPEESEDPGTPDHRCHDVPRDGHGLLVGESGGGADGAWAEGRAMTLEQAIEYALASGRPSVTV